ncbi:hypothetical protein BH11PSE8_BH11PSE8_34260 [soil metagenome]
MLRALVLALLMANLGFWAWTQGWLDNVVGVHASGDREPERLARQVKPDTVRVLPPAAPASVASAAGAASAPAALACFEAGPFTPAEATAAQTALKAALPTLPADRWTDVPTDKPGSWIVYMGKYANSDGMTKKEDELKRRRVDYTEIRDLPGLAPGLSLGRYDTQAAADAALAQFTQQGIRTAKVVETTAPSVSHVLRVDQADVALAAQLAALRADAFGKGFVACAGAEAPGR